MLIPQTIKTSDLSRLAEHVYSYTYLKFKSFY